jgi:CheY-like chemotaxis protein
VSLHDFLAALEGQLRSLLSRDVDLRVTSTATAKSLICDANQLTQAIVNLALNAQDAMPNGGVLSITVSSTADSAPDSEFVDMVVADTGIGMDDSVVSHIFEPLFTTKQRGTGLGLAIVRQIIDRHGGSISVSSVRNRGSQFRLRLPARSELPAAPEATAARTFRPRRILVVDDDLAVAAGLAEGLRAHDMNVQTVSTAAQALPAIESFGPDAVVLDLDLPDGSGVNVYHDLRHTLPSLPVIFSTGHRGDFVVAQLSDARATLLEKPYEIETLLTEIERLLPERAP